MRPQRCDGWVGTAYTLEDARHWTDRINGYRRQFGRENEPFDIIVGLRDTPSRDLYRRAGDLGITGVMCSPWSNWEQTHGGDQNYLRRPAERYRASIEHFADEILSAVG
ncbi:hypothetical protein [Rhodococcus sp. DMU1]|uniref:hypothetical protein n=1 Tax=Rhodococcus sp. DMU1 TaxID=2722825 RepID=UPI0032B7D0C5